VSRLKMNLGNREEGRVGAGEVAREAPRPHDEELRSVGPRQPGGGQDRGSSGAARSKLAAVEESEGATVGPRHEHVVAIDRGDTVAPVSVRGEDGDDLDADVRVAPRGHELRQGRGQKLAGWRRSSAWG